MKRETLILSLIAIFIFQSVSAEKLTGIPMASTVANAYKAFDGDAGTFYAGMKGSYDWVGLDLGQKFVISKVGFMPSTDSDNVILLGLFEGANSPDFSDAVPMAMIKNSAPKGNMAYLDVTCSRGFRYVRYVGPASSYGRLSELEFYGEAGKGDDSRLWQLTNLPTVVINTLNGEIPYDKEHDISSTVIIISEDGTSVLEKSNTGVRERGNASREFPKKPWRIKFEKKQNVLDAPAKAKKWTLINNYGDKSLMRNMLAFDIARKMGMEYVPFCAPVDVIMNGEYKGCYQLCDQIEVNEGRLNIDEMTKEDNSGDALTGGYFVEIDAYAYEEPVWFRTSHYGLPVTVKSPDEDEITKEQLKYITDYFNMLEPMMKDISPLTGYRTVFDNESFIQHMLVNEVAGNTDTYWSTYMYKRRNNPVIYTGPVWDFDLGFNNDYRTYPVYSRSGNGFLWNCGAASSADGMIYFAQRILLKDETTAAEIHDVWSKARNNGLSIEWLKDKVDEYAVLLDDSQKLNFIRWPILNQMVHMNPVALGTYEKECEAIKSYANAQLPHLDKVIGFDPDTELIPTEPEAGVEDLMSPDGFDDVEYFTLSGLKVNTPLSPGFYIMRNGSATQKILVR